MDKNKLCRTILDVKEIIQNNLLEELMKTGKFTKDELKYCNQNFEASLEKNFNIIVDKVLES